MFNEIFNVNQKSQIRISDNRTKTSYRFVHLLISKKYVSSFYYVPYFAVVSGDIASSKISVADLL
jgi:hypothetical protein